MAVDYAEKSFWLGNSGEYKENPPLQGDLKCDVAVVGGGFAAGVAKLKEEDISGEAALYGMIGSLPDRGMARDFAVQYLNDLYSTH